MKDIELDEYLLRSHRYFTYADMAEQLETNYPLIKRRCDKLGITPITKFEQTYQFLLARHEKKTIPELAEMTGMTEGGLRQYFYQQKWTPFVKPKPGTVTAGKILSEYIKGMEVDYRSEYLRECLKR